MPNLKKKKTKMDILEFLAEFLAFWRLVSERLSESCWLLSARVQLDAFRSCNHPVLSLAAL